MLSSRASVLMLKIFQPGFLTRAKTPFERRAVLDQMLALQPSPKEDVNRGKQVRANGQCDQNGTRVECFDGTAYFWFGPFTKPSEAVIENCAGQESEDRHRNEVP